MAAVRIWVVLSLAAGTAACWLTARRVAAPCLSNDSYQYLDAAQRFAAGECLCTHLAHFDEQIAAGHLPLPLTHFAPGYSIAIAALSWTRLSPAYLGFLLSVAGYLITLLMIWDIGIAAGARPWAVGAFSLLWIANAHALLGAMHVGTDVVFTAVLTLFVALMIRDLRSGERSRWLSLWVGVTAGAAYALRYAGIFVLPVAGLYLAWRWWRARGVRWGALAGLLAMCGLTLSIQIRNMVYTGSWRGGFSDGRGHTLKTVLVESVKAIYHVIFGDRAVARLDIWSVLFGLSFAAVIVLSFQAWKQDAFGKLTKPARNGLWWMTFVAAAYAGGIVLSTLITIASDMTRYLIPVYPIVLAGVAIVLSAALKDRRRFVAVALVGTILAVHARSLGFTRTVASHEFVANALASDVEPGVTAREWLLWHVPENGRVMSVDGQALYYVLHRDVVSILSAEFTSRRTDAEGYRSTMTRFHARYLVLFPGMQPSEVPDQDQTPFLRDLASGEAGPPEWLRLAAGSTTVAIYECASCGG